MTHRSPILLLLALLALLGGALPAGAATFDQPPLDPAEPIADQPVSARIVFSSCFEAPSVEVVRDGTLIEIRADDDPCPILPPPPPHVSVGLGSLPAGTYDLRLVDTGVSPAQVTDELVFTVVPPTCPADTLCLQNGRFRVTAEWKDFDGRTGKAQPVRLSNETGSFWFFSDRNYELMVKLHDGCLINNRFWLYSAGLTDVEVTLHVVDTFGFNYDRTYLNPLGRLYAPIVETQGFQCTCENCGGS